MLRNYCRRSKFQKLVVYKSRIKATCAFDIERGKYVQILHDGHGHWLIVRTVCIHQSAPTQRIILHQYSAQSDQRSCYILWMCRCRQEGVIVAHCNCICNCYHHYTLAKVCIRSSKDETASIPVLHEGGIADFPDSKRMTAMKYFAHQRCKVLRW